MTLPRLLAGLCVAAALVAGCGGSDSEPGQIETEDVELALTDQAPELLQAQGIDPDSHGFDIECNRDSDERATCFITVTQAEPGSPDRELTFDVDIKDDPPRYIARFVEDAGGAAVGEDEAAKEESASSEAEGSDLPPPDDPTWQNVSCAQIEEAAEASDDAFLDTAAEAVTQVPQIGSGPEFADVPQRRIVKIARGWLIKLCKTSREEFSPWATAATCTLATLSGLQEPAPGFEACFPQP